VRVAVLAPIANSLYARVVTHLARAEEGVEVGCVLIRNPWTWQRMRSELRRDGARLVRKAYRKLVLGERYVAQGPRDNLAALASRCGLPEGDLTSLCRRWDIPCQTVADHNGPVSLASLRDAAPDVIVFTGGGLIRKDLLAIPRLGVLNCHMGLLPAYRGMDVVEYPVLECADGTPRTGIAVHFMDRGIDTGDILRERKIDPVGGEPFADLRRRYEPQMALLMLEAIRGLRDGTLTPQPQAPSEGKQYFVMHPRVHALAEQRLANSASGTAQAVRSCER